MSTERTQVSDLEAVGKQADLEQTMEDPKIRAIRALLAELLEAPMEVAPSTIENPSEVASILEYIQKGGRLSGIDYNTLDAAEKEAAFAQAREILNRPIYSKIAGEDWKNASYSNKAYHHPNPNNPSEKFGAINPLKAEAVDAVMDCVETSKQFELPPWDGHENIHARIATIDRVVARMYKERNVFGVLLGLSGGKSGNEAFRDSQEFFDFANNYRHFPSALAMQQVMLRSGGDTQLSIRPFDKAIGVWQPFNFACIGFGDVISALMAGNTVVTHTSARAAGVYKWFHDICLEEGVPAERLHFVVPQGNPDDETQVDPTMSKTLAEHPNLGNIYFTGSLGIATKLAQTQKQKGAGQNRLDLNLHAEAGGYNTLSLIGLPEEALALFENGVPSSAAEWDTFLSALPENCFLTSLKESLEDSTCGLQGHKCSALSEMIFALDPSGENGLTQQQIDQIIAFTVAVMNRVKIGNVTEDPDVRMGALIDGAMKKRVEKQMREILVRKGSKILNGDGTLEERLNVLNLENAIKPIVYIDPNRAHGDDVEIFAPVFRIHVLEGGAEAARARLHEIAFALTGAVIAANTEEAVDFRHGAPSGVFYPSSDSYAPTTTAAPAPQVPFGGIKGSGTGTGLLRPGTALHPLLFADVYTEVLKARVDWGTGQNDTTTEEALRGMLNILGMRADFQRRMQDKLES